MSGEASIRVGVAALAGAAAGIGMGAAGGWQYAAAIGWDTAGALFLVWTWLVIGPMDAAATAAHATREDPTKNVTRVIVLAASVASLAGVGILLLQASTDTGALRAFVAALGVASVLVSWLVVHTLFTLRYALLYYDPTEASASPAAVRPELTGPDRIGGIDFNQRERPRYSDFAYLAFTVGMTYQLSDTPVTTRPLRSTVLRQALLSYVFGTLILGATVNLIASLASSAR
jgi:uncharacterized membrane protein